MKLPQTIQTKYTTRVFNKKYKYKIAFLTKAASLFRKDLSEPKALYISHCSDADKKFALMLIANLKKMSDYSLRVESPIVNFYTNNANDIEILAKIDPAKVKYVSYPQPGSETKLDQGLILTKRLDYDYRITMGPTKQNYTNFLVWAKDKRIKLPKTAQRMLAKDRAWGGYYFYVKDDKLLTLVKMFLGSNIQAVEHVSKQ